MKSEFQSPQDLITALEQESYILGEGLAVSLFLALRRQRPLFLEGEAVSARQKLQKHLPA